MSDIVRRLRKGAEHYANEGEMGLETLLTEAASAIESARSAALEEAAKVADIEASHRIAAAIRKLKT